MPFGIFTYSQHFPQQNCLQIPAIHSRLPPGCLSLCLFRGLGGFFPSMYQSFRWGLNTQAHLLSSNFYYHDSNIFTYKDSLIFFHGYYQHIFSALIGGEAPAPPPGCGVNLPEPVHRGADQFYVWGEEVKRSIEWLIKRLIKVGPRVSYHALR